MVQTRRKVGTPRGQETGGQSDKMQIILDRLDQQQKMIEDLRADQIHRDSNRDATIAALAAAIGQSRPHEIPAGRTSTVLPPNEQVTTEEPLVDPVSIQKWMEQFQKYKPPVFDGTFDVQVAEDWLDQLEQIFDVLECPSGRRARMAIFKLGKEARRWWKNTELVLQARGTLITWEVFKGQFQEKYFPQSVRDAKEAEFLLIQQGEKEPFDEYLDRFNRLSQYSTLKPMENEAWRTKRLVERLNGTLRERLMPHQLVQFNKAIEVCRLTERSLNHQGPQKLSVKGGEATAKNTPGVEASGNSGGRNGKKRKRQQFTKGTDQEKEQNGELRCHTCGKSHGAGQCRAEQGNCFVCGEKGHFARVCPKKADIPKPKTTGRLFTLYQAGAGPSNSPGVDPKNS